MTIDRVTWTVHAKERLWQRGLTQARVERAVRELHPLRESNGGEADWRIDAGTFVVIYDHPDGGCVNAIRIVSAWTKHRQRKLRPRESYPR